MPHVERKGYGMRPSERKIAKAALEHDLNASATARELSIPPSRVLSVLRKQGVRDYILAKMEEDGHSLSAPLAALFDALKAERVEADFTNGAGAEGHFNLGPDHPTRIKAAEVIFKVVGAIGPQAKDEGGTGKVVVVFNSTPIDDPSSEDGVVDVTPRA